MTTVKKIAKNSLFLLAGQVTSIVFGFFYFVYMARYLGAEDLGILSFALSFASILGLIGDLGLSSLMIREVSRNLSQAPRYLGSILLMKILLSMVNFGVAAIAINILGYSEPTIRVVYIITLYNIATNFTYVFYSVFQAFERFEFQSLGIILNSTLMIVGIFFAVEQRLDLIYFAFIYLIVNTIILVYSFLICIRKFTIPTLNIDWVFWKQIISESAPFWLNTVFVLIYFKIDMVMLSVMNGDSVVGWYAASYRLIDALALLPAVLMSTMYPVFSKFYVSSIDSLEFAFKKSLKLLTIISIPIGIGTTILAERIIILIYGMEYSPSVTALQILIWASVLSFINYTPATYFNSIDKQRTLMMFTFVGAILNLILNFILIPQFSYKGAAVATVSTELVVGLLLISNMHRIQNLSSLLRDLIFKSLIAGAVMGIFLLIFQNCTLILLILFAAILYFTALYIINGFEKEDISLLNQVLGR
ncbi:Membrane protein involved in the export of O-antigen, teichoic acid lipoteichoic acids [Methanosarcina horonobensis HB-1 = JCM 15518]|uniref:Membrane protein involved in the export of O-antigen, teichoic acid lipoteichoic acids n=1 Tax=Methanosarcina horonobensis HB-1 = JCM 15518 TaxID=1434110 RepID=A0A0E3S7C3_9EURY|nr:flippase [Methanosarcina horonobensis]AKB77259.1 Membrane protein involved in the export of O-antigen, teichoic acid lipoteichoic acids [Methanosarcina horonobensis HB-1 = JCM 15518]